MEKRNKKGELIAHINDHTNNKKYDLVVFENNSHPFIRTEDNRLVPAYLFFSEF